MKTWLLLLLLPFQLFSQSPDFKAFEKIISTEKLMRSNTKVFNSLSSTPNLTYLNAHFTVDPRFQYIKGQLLFHIQSQSILSDTLILDKHDNLQIDSLWVENLPVAFQSGQNLLKIHLDQIPFPWPETLKLYIEYQGIPPSEGNGFGSFRVASHGNDQPVLWTLSEPYGSSDWWPCFSKLGDKIDSLDVHITHPIDYVAASLGLRTGVDTLGLECTTHWKHRHPVAPYLVAIAVSNYAEYTSTMPSIKGPILFQNFIYPEVLEQEKPFIDATKRFNLIFEEYFGAYPFANEKYGHAQFGWGGGMEHQTMSFMGNFGYEIVSHELAHHWFGNPVTCASWQDIWLNEGFATYLTGLCFEKESANKYWPLWKAGVKKTVLRENKGSVYVYDTSAVSRIFDGRLTYYKGAMVLHMLRQSLGDSLFFKGVRTYLEQKHNAFARTRDFQKIMEQTSNIDLEYFFKQWIFAEGHPKISLSTLTNNKSLQVRIQQIQNGPANYPAFKLPVPLKISSASQDTIVYLELQEKDQWFDLELPFKATAFEIDPDNNWLIELDTIVSNSYNANELVYAYPNPCGDQCIVYSAKPLSHKTEFFLVDPNGKQQQVYPIHIGQHFVQLQLNMLGPSSYILQISSENGSQYIKLLKTNP